MCLSRSEFFVPLTSARYYDHSLTEKTHSDGFLALKCNLRLVFKVFYRQIEHEKLGYAQKIFDLRIRLLTTPE